MTSQPVTDATAPQRLELLRSAPGAWGRQGNA